MSKVNNVDFSVLMTLNSKLNSYFKMKSSLVSNAELNSLLDELILQLQLQKISQEENALYQDTFTAALKFATILNFTESFKVAKMSQALGMLLAIPNILLTNSQAENLVEWLHCAFKASNEIILADILDCLAISLHIKEVKLAKGLAAILGKNGILYEKINFLDHTDKCFLSALRVLCNFTHCPGEKEWSSISKDTLEICLATFIRLLEKNVVVDHQEYFLLKGLVFCFQGIENVFVRFHPIANPHLNTILGLGKFYMVFGMPGHSQKFNPLQPSSVPFLESAFKADQGKGPKVRKNRTPSKVHSAKNKKDDDAIEDLGSSPVRFQPKMTFTKICTLSSSDSELSDTESQNILLQKDAQAKVRASSLKMLSASFKFCEQRVVMGYWSCFLPDSSQPLGSRQSLLTPILKDPSVKVRCNALAALSCLLQAIQPTLAMASFQEKKVGAFIPFSQTVAESVIAVQRSLLLSLAAEQSTTALIQLLKCLSVAATVFPYEKLPIELASKTVQQCLVLLDHKEPDIKVACLCVLRILVCAHTSHNTILDLFWDRENKRCWLLQNCLKVVNGSSGIPLTLECLLVIGEVTRSKISLAKPYISDIISAICKKIRESNDIGVQIRAIKCLSLVCSSILQEMEKEESDQIVPRDEGVQLWVHILRNGLAEILQTNCDSPLRAEACSALATIGTQIFECLPRELRILFVTLALACAGDSDSNVRAAALRTLGFAVTFNTLNDDASFLFDCSEQILSSLKDPNALVAMNASWALGNLADTLDKDKNSLLDELPSQFLVKLIEAAVFTTQGHIKVRCNGIRALGIFLKIVDVPEQGGTTAILLDQAISIIAKQATTGNFMKNRWNSCYACGNVFQNSALLLAFPHWMEKLLDSLLLVFRNCANFKVRISAANALLHLHQREVLTNYYFRLWGALLETLTNSEHVDDFSEFQHHETMCKQICKSLCKLIALIVKDDLTQLHDSVMQHYDICASQFSLFLRSLLPDQLELVIEASNHVKQLLHDGDLTDSQKSSVELLQELINLEQ